MTSSKKGGCWSTTRKAAISLFALMSLVGVAAGNVQAGAIVVSHDINTLGSFLAGTQEETFAVNVANFLTAGSVTKNLLLFESNPNDGSRDFAPGVLSALAGAGFSMTVTTDYATPFASFDAIFVAKDFPTPAALSRTSTPIEGQMSSLIFGPGSG